jgi:iron complex transport system ATP-binding protein
MPDGLSLTDITLNRGAARLLDGVSARFPHGSLTAIIGPNGAGKSTLLRVAAGLLTPDAGGVEVAGQPLSRLSPAARAERIGFLPQARPLGWPVPVRALVALGQHPRRPDAARVEAALAEVGLRGLADRRADSLSGGELARAHLARVLAGGAQTLLLDEPVAGLDPAHQLEVLGLLAARARSGATVAVVLHDLGLASAYADRVLCLAAGRGVAEGPTAEVLTPDLLARVFGVAVSPAPGGLPHWVRASA